MAAALTAPRPSIRPRTSLADCSASAMASLSGMGSSAPERASTGRPVAIYAHNADLAGGNDDELLTVNREIACGADDDVRRAAHRQGKLPSPFPTPCFIRPVILAA